MCNHVSRHGSPCLCAGVDSTVYPVDFRFLQGTPWTFLGSIRILNAFICADVGTDLTTSPSWLCEGLGSDANLKAALTLVLPPIRNWQC